MKMMKSLLLVGGLGLGTLGLWAQSDEYLDDAYLSRKDIELRQAKAKAKAEEQRKAREEAQRLWEEQYAKERAEFLKKQRSLEIDAYNGILSAEDSLRIIEDAKLFARDRIQQSEGKTGYYGEYSRRLNRFYGDGTTVIVNNYYDDMYDTYPHWRSGISLGIGSSYYPWYDSYYSVYRNSPWGGFGWGYGPYWSHSRFYSYYDPFYDPWYYNRYYGGYYGAYYPGFYSPYYGYYGYYPYGYSSSAYYSANRYRGAARSAYHQSSNSNYRGSAYGSFEATRNQVYHYGTSEAYSKGGNTSSGYRGLQTRSSYGTQRNYDNDSYRSINSNQSQSRYNTTTVRNDNNYNYSGAASSSGGRSRSRR